MKPQPGLILVNEAAFLTNKKRLKLHEFVPSEFQQSTVWLIDHLSNLWNGTNNNNNKEHI